MIGVDVFAIGQPLLKVSFVFKNPVPPPDERAPRPLERLVLDAIKSLPAQPTETPEVVLHRFERVRSSSSGQVVQRLRDQVLIHHVVY